ncbi:molybdopterin cofactor-binding domain-containing protein [Pseudoroseomonas wenyumeiae]
MKAKAFEQQGVAGRPDLVSEIARRFPNGVEAEGSIAGMADDPNYKDYSQHTYGASFAEVAVDIVSGEVRLRRMLGVFAAGRIINPKTARSQLIGGMVWGVGSALHEAAHVDPRFGNVVNGDLAEYVVPVHADIPPIFEAVLLDDVDDKANPLGMKGVGEPRCLWHGRGGGQCSLQRHRGAGARLPDYLGQPARRTATHVVTSSNDPRCERKGIRSNHLIG